MPDFFIYMQAGFVQEVSQQASKTNQFVYSC